MSTSSSETVARTVSCRGEIVTSIDPWATGCATATPGKIQRNKHAHKSHVAGAGGRAVAIPLTVNME